MSASGVVGYGIKAKPQYNQLIQNLNGKSSIVDQIAANRHVVCQDFATLLLKNDLVTISTLLKSSQKDDDEFIRSVFKTWLAKSDSDKSAVPRTWSGLAQCVRSTPGLPGTLADYLDDIAKGCFEKRTHVGAREHERKKAKNPVVETDSTESIFDDIPAGKLDEKVPNTGAILGDIAKAMTDWQHLSIYADLTPADENIISSDQKSLGKQKIEFLRKWEEKHYHQATYRNLIELLQKGEEHAAIEVIRKALMSSRQN